MRNIIFILTVGIGIALLLAACGDTQKGTDFTSASPRPVSTPSPVQPAPGGEFRVTFVELGSVNCVPCKMMQPIMKEIEQEYAGQVKVVFHDVWTPAGEPFARSFRIRVIPTQVFLDSEGREYFRHEGFFPKAELVKILQMKGVQ